MALEFQPRADGFRVVRQEPGGVELMIASICNTRPLTFSGNKEEWEEALKDVAPELHDLYRKNGVVIRVPCPCDECTIHTAGGPMTVADIKEMLAKLEK